MAEPSQPNSFAASDLEDAPLIGGSIVEPPRPWYKRCWNVISPRGRKRRIPKWVANNVLLFSFLWQCFVIVLYRVAFNKAFSSTGVAFDLGVGIMVLMQVLQLVFIIIISVKLSKQVLHQTVTNWFLVQTYLATILLFAGLYTVIERAVPLSFRGVFDVNDSLTHEIVTIRFVYLSVQVMTTATFGDIVSNEWYVDMLVTLQMLLSVLYTTVIFSKGLAFFSLNPPMPRRKKRDDSMIPPEIISASGLESLDEDYGPPRIGESMNGGI